ncbi:hypothetical protein [Streptomyces mangrovisoli]|uniref:Uncharacterized protein n=1 Tax=Streptomyces mangrovisoli TaxID=1428628 RepID=A0A1J4NK49_9ACTN|nr:hypothetical protein [Streptomyces mangrovisoli]OIJ62761.1 hypothetical protein WN71_037775 [Streptomyces mangrovisoli]
MHTCVDGPIAVVLTACGPLSRRSPDPPLHPLIMLPERLLAPAPSAQAPEAALDEWERAAVAYRAIWQGAVALRPVPGWSGRLDLPSGALLIRRPDRQILYQGTMETSSRWRAAVRSGGAAGLIIAPWQSMAETDLIFDDRVRCVPIAFDGA